MVTPYQPGEFTSLKQGAQVGLNLIYKVAPQNNAMTEELSLCGACVRASINDWVLINQWMDMEKKKKKKEDPSTC